MFSCKREIGGNFETIEEENGNLGRNRRPNNDLRSVEEIPHGYQQIFSEFSNFNVIQSRVMDDVLYTDNSLVVAAPTGSGKTVLFELAIVRLLISLEHTQYATPFKIVYICPMKALCEERLVDWHKKFSNFGINAIAVTGDSENIEFRNLLNHNLIITTPEKWDCLTRKWRENIKLVQMIRLFMIDEIHLLNEESRGSTLETIVCRMKTIRNFVNTENNCSLQMRFVAVSATIPNAEDVAQWLDNTAKHHMFSHEYRPVKLKTVVLGYSQVPNTTPFKFDMSLSYKLHSLIMQYSHGKPTLIFCGTRKIVEMTAKHILDNLTINLKPEQLKCLSEAAETISDSKVKSTLVHGVGYHHAGMLPQTRRVVENLFRNGDLPILVTTSTLAMGVNLPAHLVIIKSTKCYTNGGFTDYTGTTLLQMIGRAGRPQYDTEATALILTSSKDKEKFEKMIGGLQPIESDLHRHLIEHLNAEVVLETITDLNIAMRWLSSTFLYIRARKNPRYYGLTSSDPSEMDRRLMEMCQIELNKLIKAGMLTIDQDVLLKATSVGSAMARYYLAFETMKLFTQISGGEILQQILGLISKCFEFSSMYLRVNDKKCLNLLNKCRTGQSIRFPLNGKIKTLDMKINCIIQAVLGCLDICDHSILTEALNIMRNGERIVKCLREYLEAKEKCYQALLSTIILAKCFSVQLWENSSYVSKQLPGIGNVLSSQLAKAGKTTFKSISESDPRDLEIIMNKKPPAGDKLLEQVSSLPRYVLKMELLSKTKIKLTVSLKNALDLDQKCTVNRSSMMYLLVGNTSNDILLYEKYSHLFFIENPDIVKFVNFPESSLDGIHANLISDDWVGIDCSVKLELDPKKESVNKGNKIKPHSAKKCGKNDPNDTRYMQNFMEMYLKCKQNKEAKRDSKQNLETPKSGNEDKIIIHSNIQVFNNTDDVKKCEQSEGKENFQTPNKQMKNPVTENTNQSTNFQKLIKNFQFTPRKQLINKRNQNYDNSEEPVVKKVNTEDKSKSQTKITWRSPLTYSPSVKFSPKINYNRVNFQDSDGRASSSSMSTPKVSKTNRSSAVLTPAKSTASFPLSDRAYCNSSLDDSEERRSEVLEKVGDVVSTSFLEECGLISRQKDRKKDFKTPNEYYHELLAKPKRDNEEKSEVSFTGENKQSDFFFTPKQREHSTQFFTKERSSRPVIKDTNRSSYFNQLASGLSHDGDGQNRNYIRVKRDQLFEPRTEVAAHGSLQRSSSGEVLMQHVDDDVFNDSFESIFNTIKLPQSERETQDRSRRSSFNVFDFEDDSLRDLLQRKEEVYSGEKSGNLPQPMRRSSFQVLDIEDDSLRDLLKRKEEVYCGEKSVNLSQPKRREIVETPYSMTQQNQDFANYEAKPEKYCAPEWNYQNQPIKYTPSYFDRPVVQAPVPERTTPYYGTVFPVRENMFEPPYSLRRNEHPDLYNPRLGCYHNYQEDGYNEGYCYLRRSMEKENDPFLMEEPYSNPEFRTFPQFYERQGFPERPFNTTFSDPDGFYRQSYLPQYGAPQAGGYPHFAFPQAESRRCYEPRAELPHTQSYPSDKNYVMNKFFTEL